MKLEEFLERLVAASESALQDELLASEARELLQQMIIKDALLRGEFVLSSGKTSNYYLDLRRITLNSQAAPLIGYLLLTRLKKEIAGVGGPSLGADPIVGAMVTMAHFFGRSLKGFLIRKEPKKYGTRSLIEGPVSRGDQVAIVEDVATSGGSLMKSIDAARSAGLVVKQAFCLVDRQEADVAGMLAEKGIDYEPLFTISDIL